MTASAKKALEQSAGIMLHVTMYQGWTGKLLFSRGEAGKGSKSAGQGGAEAGNI